MSYNLTERQKGMLKWFVQQVRAGSLPEDFAILLSGDRPILSRFQGGRDSIPDITDTMLKTLDDAGMLTATLSPRGTWNCTLTGKAYEAVDSGFGIPKAARVYGEGATDMTSARGFQGKGVPKVFISHSTCDRELAQRLIRLLRSSLNLTATEIRCTSVEGYRLPGGANVNEQLLEELLEAPVFIGLISEVSSESAYVLLELGARWGARKHLIPLLAPNVSSRVLEGPIAGLNALSCRNVQQLQQLIKPK